MYSVYTYVTGFWKITLMGALLIQRKTYFNKENLGWFLGDIISWAMPTLLWSLLYSYYRTV